MQYRSIVVAVAVGAVTALLAGCPDKKPTSSPAPIASVAAIPIRTGSCNKTLWPKWPSCTSTG